MSRQEELTAKLIDTGDQEVEINTKRYKGLSIPSNNKVDSVDSAFGGKPSN